MTEAKKFKFHIEKELKTQVESNDVSVHDGITPERKPFFENSQTIAFNDPIQTLGDLRLLKIREVATILGCSTKDAYTLSYECGLPTRKLRGRVRVLGSDLKKWLEGLPTKRRSTA